MAETASKKVTLRYPVNINGTSYPAGIPIDVPADIASEAERLSNVRLDQELKRMEARPDSIVPVGIDPVTGRPFRN